jgi:hypothetical protein
MSFVGTVNAGNDLGMKNRIINGAMVINQRNAGNSVSVTNNSNTYYIDRWRWGYGSSGTYTSQRVVDAPSGFYNSLKMTVTSTATVDSTNGWWFYQAIEGYNVVDLGWGASGASTITLSFWVKSSLTGTYGVNIDNGGTYTRHYTSTYTINSANTWEYKTITVPGDTTGTWAKDSSGGTGVRFFLGAGSALKIGTPNTWNTTAGDSIVATGTVNWVTSSSATWQVTGVQFEKGSVATAFENRQYGQELALCHRYFQDFRSGGQRNGFPLINTITGDASRVAIFPSLVQMRSAPTITTYATDSTTSGVVTLFSAGTNQAVSSVNQNSGPNIGSGYLQLSGNISNPVYFGATYESEL